MWVPPAAQVAAIPPVAPMFPAQNVAMGNVVWPIPAIPGRTILVLWELNGSTSLLLKAISDSLHGFFGCPCTPFNAVSGFGGDGWGCIRNMVLITGVLALVFITVSSSAFGRGVREGVGTAGG